MGMDIKIISAYDHPQEISELFSEYTDMLIAGDSSFKQYLEIQHYDNEIKNLEGALHLYKEFGFYEIESYNDSPVSAPIYMRLDLQTESTD